MTFQGIEDYLGDMDMKIASTKEGVTAIQADIKTCGIPLKVIVEAIEKSLKAKNQILNIMSKCASKPREGRKACWPVSKELILEPNQRSQLIGPGGMNVKKIFIETGAHISETTPGTFSIFAPSQQAMDEAQQYIDDSLKSLVVPDLEFGAIYTATIVEMKNNGVMVKLFDTMKPTMIHVAQLDNRRVSNFV